jgi:hypothetical protein
MKKVRKDVNDKNESNSKENVKSAASASKKVPINSYDYDQYEVSLLESVFLRIS